MNIFKIDKAFGKNLAFRKTAREFIEFLKDSDYTILDFSNISFVSRSFANEFSVLEKKERLNFQKINMNKDIETMFNNSLKESPKNNNNSGYNIGDVNKILSLV